MTKLDDDKALCAVCGKPKDQHFGLKLNCPLSRTVKPGSCFTRKWMPGERIPDVWFDIGE